MEQLMQNDPERYATMVTGPVEPYQPFYMPPVTTKVTGVIYTIPVVFHIIHNNGTENISDAQVMDALAILNRDFRRLNADADQVQPVFQGMPSDAEFEFKLATVAPNGACFNGITRTVSTLTNNGSSGENQINAIISGNNVYQGVWAHNKYLNIYVAKDLGGAGGYTFLPNGNSTASATNMYYNGIFILQDYCGSIGTSTVGRSRALTHEVGHWLNLPHVWGAGNTPGLASNCNQDDGVQDTPNCAGVQSCVLTNNSCNSDDAYWGMAMPDNVENYMDYSYCSKMYTQGQVTKMRTAIVSSVGGRSNIWTTANLQAVGAIPGTSLCALDFTVNQTTICAGTSITYEANTSTGISSYSWSFPGGTPATSTAASPTVTYSTPGTYNATLTVTSSANGQNYTESKTSYIVVNSNTTVNLPITQGFTTATFPPAGWTLINLNGSGTWARSGTVGVAPSAGNSMLFDNYQTDDGDDDVVRMQAANLVGYTSAQLTFDVAYAMDNNYPNNQDGLQVLVSTDCGATFTSVYSKSGSTLATTANVSGSFTPSGTQWRNEVINMTAYAGQGSVIVAFKNLSAYGNRLFVDNINFTGVTGTAAPVASFSSPGATVCAGQSITYTNTSTNSPTSYSWSFPGGTPATSTAANPTVTYNTAGTYNVSLTATNSGGSHTSTQPNYVTVNPTPATPTIAAGGATTFCQGGSVTLTSSAASGNTWSNGSTSQSITVNSSGSYTVTVASAGCTSAPSAATAVTVNPTPSAPTISAGGPLTFCSGGSVVLTSSSATGNNWSNGSTSQSITVTTSGTYTVTRTSGGCTSPASSGITVTVNPTPATPTISAGGPLTFCSGGSVVLTSSAGSGNTWSNGSTSPSITVSSSGTYSVTVANAGCTSAASAGTTVTVNPTPSAPTISAGGPLTFCSGGSVVLTSSSATGNNWSNGSTSQSITVSTSGTYTVTRTSSGCTSPASSGITVTVNPTPATPTITAGGATTFCQGGSVVLTSSAGSGNTWSNGSTSPSITVTNPGTYTVSVTSGSCTSGTSAGTTVIVNPNPVITLGTVVNPSACGTTSGSIQVTGSGTGNLSWSGSATGTLTNVTLPATIPTLGAGTYTLSFSNGCSSNVLSQSLTDPGAPSAPTITAEGATTFCQGEDVVLTSSAATGNTWSNGSTAQSITVSTPGTYTVTVTSAGCTSNPSAGTTVTVNPTPATPTITAGGPVAFCQGGNVVLTSSSAAGNTWSNGSTAQTITVTTPGTYTVSVTEAGCTSGASTGATVVVNPNPTVTFGTLDEVCVYDAAVTLTQGAPAGGSYSGTGVTGGQFNPATAGLGTYSLTYAYTDGNGCSGSAQSSIVVDECLGLEDNELSSVNVFPNPSSGNLVIDAGTDQLVSITVYDRLGKLVLSQEVEATSTNIDLSFVADGVYTLRIVTSAGIQHLPVMIKK